MHFSKVEDCFYFVYTNYANYSANIIFFFLFFSPVSLFVLVRPRWCLRFPSERSLASLILTLTVIPQQQSSAFGHESPLPGPWKAVSSFFLSPCLRSNEIQLSFTMICEVANGVDICSVNSEDRPFLFFPLWN